MIFNYLMPESPQLRPKGTEVEMWWETSSNSHAIIGLVACWALAGVRSELVKAENLRRPTRYNFYDWPEVDVSAVRLCALVLSLVCLFLAVVATLRRIAPRKSAPLDAFENRALRV